MGIGLVALILIHLEFFVPGGILGTLGGIAFLFSLALFVWEVGSGLTSLIYVIVMILLLIFTIRFSLWRMKQKPAFFAKEEQSGYLASTYDNALIGKVGKTVTELRPSGHIMIEGEQYQAVSESHFIKKGESIKVVAGEGARLIVRRC